MVDDERPVWPPPGQVGENSAASDAGGAAPTGDGPSRRLSRIVGLPMLVGVAVLAASLRFGVRRELCLGSATAGTLDGRTPLEGCRPGQRDHLVGAPWVFPVMMLVGSAMFLLLMSVPLLARRLDRSPTPD